MEDGVWRTVGGRRIFIKEGQDLASAMKESGKFTNNQKEKTQIRKPKDITKEELQELKKMAEERDEDGNKIGETEAVFKKYRLHEKHPEKLNEKDFNNFQGKEIYRGIGAESEEKADYYKTQFTDGDIYTGYNNSGSGTWFSDNKGVAENYSIGGGGTTTKNSEYSFILETKIDSNAKIIDVKDLPSKMERMKMYGVENDKTLSKILYDDGLYATMLGYDIIKNEVGFTQKRNNYSVLNRNVLKVKK